tara:strand:- start:4677 stop:4805 length:129 start_codon:yes stop_codon:yes gene_type:complete
MDKIKELFLITCIAGFATTGCATTASFMLGGASAAAALRYFG